MLKTPKIQIALLIFLILFSNTPYAGTNRINSYQIKTIVLDAGHGGHDTGCHGPTGSYEKNVTLKVILALGKLIEEKYPNIKVLYTRKTDVFITLQDRALTANKNDADVFISVHCNANPNKAAYGVETYLMGMHVTEANLEVAKRENEVIKLEDNYEETYEGFDPDSPEATIALSLAQNANIEQSSYLAGRVQEDITKKLDRFSRGVKQAGFWVLYRTTCPSILIETGFLTNKTEEKFLISDEGQQQLAQSICDAFTEYKDAVEKGGKLLSPVIINTEDDNIPVVDTNEVITPKDNTNTPPPPPDTTPEKIVTPVKTNGISYKVQLKASSKKLLKSDKVYKSASNIQYEYAKGVYKYLSGPYTAYASAAKFLKKAKSLGYKDAFISVYKNGKRLSLSESKQYLK